eukprot:c28057_g1_i1 orf=534-2480(-)
MPQSSQHPSNFHHSDISRASGFGRSLRQRNLSANIQRNWVRAYPRFSNKPSKFRSSESADGFPRRPQMRGSIRSLDAFRRITTDEHSNGMQFGQCGQFSAVVKQEFPADIGQVHDSVVPSKLNLVTDSCNELWQELKAMMQTRESILAQMKEEIETSLKYSQAEQEAARKERAEAEAMKQEAQRVCETAQEETRKAKAEKEALERISTDISVQFAELKRLQHQLQQDWVDMGVRLTELKDSKKISNLPSNFEVECEASVNALKTEYTSHWQISEALEHTVQKVTIATDLNHTESIEINSDELDEIALSKRMELLRNTSQKANDPDNPKVNNNCDMPSHKRSACDDELTLLPVNIGFGKRAKKYKLPFETILQEDAPGLFEKLQEKGLLNNINVYGDFFEEFCVAPESDQDEFKDLEDVVQKLWGTPTGLLKQSHANRQCQQVPNNKPSYCLACLASLIEQTKSLRQHNWPVEWGWCRQLLAFIFVFDKHNRIVLERPEYGYATYFFELVDTLPLKWQVGRLIKVMGAATVGRTAVLENRPLEVNQDMTAEEAMILEDYGWVTNTGIGSLLNFCDRVVHDVKDDDNTDWRQKIGKCLMDGYDHGRIAVKRIPQKLQESLGFDEKNEDEPIDSNIFSSPDNEGVKAEPAV